MSLVSLVVPVYNEEDNVKELLHQIAVVLKDEKYEVIFVDDGSTDNSLATIKKIAIEDKKVKFISFSRNFGHQAALRAGLKYARGDAVISMDADLQHPPKLLPDLIKAWREGHQIVYTIRKDGKETGLKKRVTSRLFYKVLNFLSDLNMQEGAADFRLLDRQVVEVVNSQRETDIFLRGYVSWVGFRQLGIEYIPAARFSGSSKYTLKKMIKFASHGVTQFSVKPLRLAYVLAMLAFMVSVGYIFYAVWISIAGQAIPGWLSIVVLVVFLQGFQFLLIGMVGEYVGRTFMQTKYRPEFILSETNCNSIDNA